MPVFPDRRANVPVPPDVRATASLRTCTRPSFDGTYRREGQHRREHEDAPAELPNVTERSRDSRLLNGLTQPVPRGVRGAILAGIMADFTTRFPCMAGVSNSEYSAGKTSHAPTDDFHTASGRGYAYFLETDVAGQIQFPSRRALKEEARRRIEAYGRARWEEYRLAREAELGRPLRRLRGPRRRIAPEIRRELVTNGTLAQRGGNTIGERRSA